MGVGNGTRDWLGAAVLLLVGAAVLGALWRLEARRRVRAEQAYRTAAAVVLAVLDADLGSEPAVRQYVARAALDACLGDTDTSGRRLSDLLADAAPGYELLQSPEQLASARAFLAANSALSKRFLLLVERARDAEQEGRVAVRIRAQLRAALMAAATGSEPAVRQALERVADNVDALPFRRSVGGVTATVRGPDAGQRAMAVLLECAQPAEAVSGVLAEGAQAVAKVRLLARHRLFVGEHEQALWLAETCAFLLGLRPVPGADGVSTALSECEPVVLPHTESPSAIEALLDTATNLLQGRRASGKEAFPADELLSESRRLLGQGRTDEAAQLARAGLNVLGMGDQAIEDMLAVTE